MDGALGGASGSAAAAAADAYRYHEGQKPTAFQEQVARELGCDEERIADMRANGMRLVDWARILPASDLMAAIEERYGVDFRADWVNVGSSWELGCTAVDGPHAGESFTVYAPVKDDVPVRYGDDYYGAYRSDEYQEFVEGIAGDVLEGAGFASSAALRASLTSNVYHDVALDDPFVGGEGSYHGKCEVFLVGTAASDEAAGEELAEELAGACERSGASLVWRVYGYPGCQRAADVLDYAETHDYAWYAVENR